MSSTTAAAAIPASHAEQIPTCEQKGFSSQRRKPGEQQHQWPFHQYLQLLITGRVHQYDPSVHLEPSLHFSDLRAALVFFLLFYLLFLIFTLYAALLPGHIHTGARIQSTLRGHSILLQRNGLWPLPRACTSPAEWPCIQPEPHRHEYGQQSPESVMLVRTPGLRHFRSRDQRTVRVLRLQGPKRFMEAQLQFRLLGLQRSNIFVEISSSVKKTKKKRQEIAY